MDTVWQVIGRYGNVHLIRLRPVIRLTDLSIPGNSFDPSMLSIGAIKRNSHLIEHIIS